MNQEMPKFNFEVSDATAEDMESVLKVNAISWIDTYKNEKKGLTEDILKEVKGAGLNPSAEAIEKAQKWIANPPDKSHCWVAKVDGKVVAYVWPRVDESGKNRVGQLYMLPEYKGKGIGSALLDKVINYFNGQNVYLEVADYNTRAIDFYKNKGFEFTGYEENSEIVSGKSIHTKEMVHKG